MVLLRLCNEIRYLFCLTADCEGQTMYVRYMCVSSGAPCAQSHDNPTKQTLVDLIVFVGLVNNYYHVYVDVVS